MIKYAVIEIYKDDYGFPESTVLRHGFEDIKDAEKRRIDFIKADFIDPQNVIVVSYKL